RGEALRGVAVEEQPVALGDRRHADLQVLEAATLAFAGGPHAGDGALGALDIEGKAVPALGEACGSRVRRRRVSTEDDRGMRLLRRLWSRLDVRERDEPPLEAGLFHRPEREHRAEILLRARALFFERHTERRELGLEVADADAEDQSPARENVER